METDALGLALDSSVLITAERRRMTAAQAVEWLVDDVGDTRLVLPAVTIAELGFGVYRTIDAAQRIRRRRFLDDLKATIPVHPFTAITAELVARIGATQASQGVRISFPDLMIGASALELQYGVATSNLRDFAHIPGLKVVSV